MLVLDDLWVTRENQEERAILLNVLDAGQSGSRVLVTAQKKDVAAALGAEEQIPIPDMEEKQYFSMFMHYALEGKRVGFFFERERQKICHSNILEEVKINFTNRHSPKNLTIKNLDRTLTLKEKDPTTPLTGIPAARDRLHLHQ